MEDPTTTTNPLQVIVYTSSLPRKCQFACKDASDHAELTAEFPPVTVAELFSYPIRRRTRGVQAAGGSRTGSSQTMLNYPRHATSQYEARQFNHQEIDHHLNSIGFQTFLSKASLRVERVLVENCLFNPFIDHVNRLICSDDSLDPARANDSPRKPVMKHCAGPAPRRLMHQSDLCEGKFVSSLHCHPTFPGVIAAGYASKIQMEQRQLYRDSSRNNGRHYAIIWKTTQLLEPTIILEAPDDILCIRFNHHHPYVLAASCHSGMIVVWDVSGYVALMKGPKNKWQQVRAKEITPVVIPVAATLENYPCTSKRIEWTPNSVEFSAKGPTGVTANKNLWQLYSCYDGFMTVWDIRLMEESFKPTSLPVPRLPSRVRPAFKIFPVVKDKRRDVAITCFAMIDHSEKKGHTRLSELVSYPPICIAGTDEGEIFIIDWRNYSDMERGAACTANLCIAFHDGAVVDIIPAPHISNTVLSIGGRIWALWKSVELEGPVLELAPRPVTIQSAAWSPWQTSIVAIGLADGLVEIWDIILSTSRPQRQMRISKSAITSIGFGRDDEGTYIAITDADGTGKITLLPFFTKSLCPGVRELTRVEKFMDSEVHHRLSMAQMLQPAPVAPQLHLPESPLIYSNREAYMEDFKILEKKILKDVGDV
ncbi:dynein axonemal intermediate chain 3-like isoform X1 [Daphnia pulex]|uniref:dynein axonemal intermediate chain 3-like isoform X1 n=2 Tax=Daphnia pulex TaxID=6669 RepID=UPI001EDFB956|nr:dynein axonemal intermediate chain 3-like isoform X1 [Daphnia pulex]